MYPEEKKTSKMRGGEETSRVVYMLEIEGERSVEVPGRYPPGILFRQRRV